MLKKEVSRLGFILRYSISFGVCLIISTIIVFSMGILESWQVLVDKHGWNMHDELTKNMYILSNATFIVGVICLGLGLMTLAANGGAFEMIGYGISRFISLFRRDHTKVRFQTFYDYHAYKSEQPKPPFLYLVVVGLFYIGISIIFVTIWYNNTY